MWRIEAALRGIGGGLMFVYFGTGSLFFSWIVLPLVTLLTRDRVVARDRCQTLVSAGFRQFHWFMTELALLRFYPNDVEVKLPPGPCVIIANHPTLVDVTAVLSVVRRACIVVRHGLYNGRLMGPLLKRCHHIDAGDGTTMPGAAVIQGAVERIEAGSSVLIFPEGTRSPFKGLHRFHRGAFEIALRARVPIVPLFITCDPPVLRKGQMWYDALRVAPLMKLTFLDPIAIDFAVDDRRQLTTRFEELYRRQLELHGYEQPRN